MIRSGDIDIDLPDRIAALAVLKHTPASIKSTVGPYTRHNSGIYVTDIPINPITGFAAIDHKTAEERDYVKIDLLNMSVYQQVRDEAHLIALVEKEPLWEKLYDKEFCQQLTHIGNHHHTLLKMPEKVNSIPRLAMFISIIRPGKSHLVGLPWGEVAKTIWDKTSEGYSFKKSHGIAYSHLIVLNMNLLVEKIENEETDSVTDDPEDTLRDFESD